MKKYLAIIFLFVSVAASAQSWMWGAQGSNESDTYPTAVDNFGNAYITGTFIDSISFGAYHIKLKPSSNNVYFVKYDSVGNVVWVENSTGPNNVFTYGTATDLNGNAFITGYFFKSTSFGSASLNSLNQDAFLIKYDKSGNVIWAKQSRSLSSSSGGQGNAIATDNSGNIYVTGLFDDSVSFGKITLVSKNESVFLAKYDSNGNVIWAKQNYLSSEYSEAMGSSVFVDNYGKVYLTGEFSDTIMFAKDTLVINTGSGAMFLTKFDTSGNVIWAKQSNASSKYSSLSCNSVIADSYGNVYITGGFNDTISFGSNILRNISSGGIIEEMFLVKYNTIGSVVWAKQSSYVSSLNYGWIGYALSIDMFNHIYFAGGTGNADSLIFCGDTLLTKSIWDPSIILEFDTSGKITCNSMVCTGGDDNNCIVSSPSGRFIYFGGDLLDSVTFGKNLLVCNHLFEPPFIARWQPCGGEQGVENINQANQQLKVSPNPSTGIFTFQIADGYQPIANGKMEVYNMLGEIIMNETLRPLTQGQGGQAQGDNKIDLNAQPIGIYLYRVTDEYGQLIGSGKLIKE